MAKPKKQNTMKEINTRNANGVIDLTDAGRATYAAKIRKNIALPYKGMHMHYISGQQIWAINRKNALRKGSGIIVPKERTNVFSNLYTRILANLHVRKANKI